MARKTATRAARPSRAARKTRTPRTASAPRRTRANGDYKRWWEMASKVMFKDIGRLLTPCGAAIVEKTGSEYHGISVETKYATWPSGAHVGFSTKVFTFGAGVPVTYTKKATGYSFSGKLPVCTANSTCTNGQYMVWLIKLQGEIDIATADRDLISYSYSVNATCGGVPACTEQGTFKGERFGGTDGKIEGQFSGTQEWTVKCCPTRHKPK